MDGQDGQDCITTIPSAGSGQALTSGRLHFSIGEVEFPAKAGTTNFATGEAAIMKSPGVLLVVEHDYPGNTTPPHDIGSLISGNSRPYHNSQVDLLSFFGIGSADKAGGAFAPPAARGPARAILGHLQGHSLSGMWRTGVPSGAIPTLLSDTKRHKMAQNGTGN